MGKYADEDVERLVKEVREAFDWVMKGKGTLTRFTGHSTYIVEALKPFLPDPEDKLIEEMAEAIYLITSPGGSWKRSPFQKTHIKQAKAALEVVKKWGLP